MQLRAPHTIGRHGLPADIAQPPNAQGVVIFARGSGSGRLSPRNLQVARRLNSIGFATILFDLLSEEEAAERGNVFDIDLLSSRVSEAIEYARRSEELRNLPIGLFGASTGSAAALLAAARSGQAVAAIVSRGGRPDLAADELAQVQAPTLLIVGGDDEPVLGLNRNALYRMRCIKRLEIVAGATHLFEEPGALEKVIELAGAWFAAYLRPAS